MLLGEQWGFLLALVASVPYVYTAVTIYIWDHDLGSRKNTIGGWVIWGISPVSDSSRVSTAFSRLL